MKSSAFRKMSEIVEVCFHHSILTFFGGGVLLPFLSLNFESRTLNVGVLPSFLGKFWVIFSNVEKS